MSNEATAATIPANVENMIDHATMMCKHNNRSVSLRGEARKIAATRAAKAAGIDADTIYAAINARVSAPQPKTCGFCGLNLRTCDCR